MIDPTPNPPGILPTSQPSAVLRLPTLDEILDSPLQPTVWMLPRFLAVGDVCILGGPGYSGKSWIVADLALTWASGFPALSWAPPFVPQRVLWVDEEQSRSEAWNRVRQIVNGRGIPKQALRETFLYPDPRQGINFKSKGHFRGLMKLVEDFNPQWVIFDSLIAVSRAERENDSSELRAFYSDCLQPICNNGQRGVLLIHHTRKSNPASQTSYDFADGDNLRGASDIRNSADSVIMCWRTGGNTFLHSNKARSDLKHGSEPPWDLKLALVESGGGYYPKVISEEPPAGKIAAHLDKLIVEALEGSSTGLSTTELTSRINDLHGCSPSETSLYRSLKILSEDHKIQSRKSGRNTYWELPTVP